jgi:glycosyltransferase involved in cell wall biosynthesis
MTTQRKRVLMILENCSYLRDARVGKEARALRDNGYQVSVISPESSRLPSRVVVEGIVVYGFPQLSLGSGTLGYLLEYVYATLAIALTTAFAWFTERFDIVHVANPPDCLVLVTAFYKLFGVKVIYDQHDLSPELYVARFSTAIWVLSALQLSLERISYKLADHVIVTNESAMKIAVARGGVPQSKVTVVRNGPLMERFETDEKDAELLKKAANIIAFAGITGYQDGLDYLCNSLQMLRHEFGKEDFFCVVMGDGDALSWTKERAQQLGIDDKMWFTGWIDQSDVYCRYLSTADVCVAPEPSNSYNDRSTFVKIMEYMASGKPIVAFDLPENRFSAGPSALYAAPNSCQDFAAKLALLMDDKALQRSMGQAGRRRVESELAWQYSVPNLLRVYDSVAQ